MASPDRSGTAPEAAGIGGTGVDATLLERLLPHLAESIMVLDPDWSVKANLAPPGGLIGRGLGIGLHTLEDMHPDDTVQVLELGTQAFTTDPGWEGSMVVRMRRGDGTYGRYEITATNRFDDPVIDGMVVRTREVVVDDGDVATGLDHTGLVETLAHVLPMGVVLLDPAGRPVFANAAACLLLGLSAVELKRAGLAAAVAPADHDLLATSLAHVGATAGRLTSLLHLDAGAVEVELTLSSEGAPVSAIVATFEDVTERRAAEHEMRRRAECDPLTGLGNRAWLLDRLRDLMGAGAALTVAYIDLDGFKAVNDADGHAAGDALLAAVADALQGAAGPEVEVARVGGDEFVAVATGRAAADPAALESSLRRAVADASRERGAGSGASVGTAGPRPADLPRDVLRRADAAMYADKRRHRMADPA